MNSLESLELLTTILKDNYPIDYLSITPEAKLQDDLGLDSLDIVELTMKIEDELPHCISDDEIETWVTVKDVCKTIDKYLP